VLRKSVYDKARDRLAQSELFLDIVAGPDTCDVRYYFADHATCQLFWVGDVPLASLGLPEFGSDGEIRLRLTPEYWTHVEYFPMHLSLRQEAEDLIVAVLRHGCVDNMTSPGSTFPFGEAECRQYLSIFEGYKSSDSPKTIGYRNAVIARVSNAISRARYINSWGLERPRLDRLQGLNDFANSQMKESLSLITGELFCLLLSRGVFTRITSMWNGRVVYQRHWNNFFNDMRAEWLRMAGVGGAIWLGSATMLASGHRTFFLVSSTALSGASVFVSFVLHHKHSESALATGPDVSRYIMSVESYYHGLRPLSIVYVVPHALIIYSAVCFNAALVTVALGSGLGILGTSAVAAVLALALFAVFGTLSFFDHTLTRLIFALEQALDTLKKVPRARKDRPRSEGEKTQ